MSKILVTGVAGFIGFHLCKRYLQRGDLVFGIDNVNDYYDVTLKTYRLSQLDGSPGFTFEKMDLVDRDAITQLFDDQQFDVVVHLAAQAGVRYSLTHPHTYLDSNLVGFLRNTG